MSQLWKTLLCCTLAAGTYWTAVAQDGCGFNPTPEQMEYLSRTRSQRQHADLRSNTTIRWIPIQFHECVATSGQNAQPELSYDYFTPCLADLNDWFAPYGVQFYECSPARYFANNNLYGFDSSEEPLLSTQDVSNVLNVYFFKTVTIGGNPACGYSYLPPSADRVIMAKGCTDGPTIFLHEVGHYLGLYHTHGKGNTAITDELVNGSNCQTAGDEICDTPADPGRGYYGCNYVGAEMDANGQVYQPDLRNIMSIINFTCKDQFTPQQLSRMAYTAINDRANLNGCPHPNDCQNPIRSLPQHFDFETGLEDWSNSWIYPEWMLPFVQGSGATPTSNTGPDSAWSGTHYVYIESSVDTNSYGRYGLLRSPCFDLRGYTAPKMSFRYHAYGTGMVEYVAQVSTNGGITWDAIPESLLFYSMGGNAGNTWNLVECDLTAFKNAPNFQVRIGAGIGSGELGDFAIDDIRFYNDSLSCNYAVTTSPTQVTCHGANNGQLTVQVSGQNGALTYSWSNGATTSTISNLAAGIYTVTVTDSLGCVLTVNDTIVQPSVLQASLSSLNVTTTGQNQGSISSSVNGGTAPYTYLWSNSSTSANISGLFAGTYTVSITDANNCTIVLNRTITEPQVVCASNYSNFPWSGSFESNYDIFERVMGYQTNWVRRAGATPNPNTGPNAANNGNIYAFINSFNAFWTAVLQTKHCLNLTSVNSPVLEFYYHMSGAQMGTLNVDISTNNGVNWTTAWSLSGDQGNQWAKAIVDLQLFKTANTRIRFRGVGTSKLSDIAIDGLYIGSAGSNLQVHEPPTMQFEKNMVKLAVYPNPSPGVFNVETNEEEPVTALEVYNQAGTLVWKAHDPFSQYRIDLSIQPSGVYFLRAQLDGEVVVKKLMLFKN